jgi:K+-sensing histidine kinase KdpD
MNAMRRLGRDRTALLAALVIPPAVAAALTPWRASMPNLDAALILVVVVVALAANGHRAAGILAAASAAAWFDFFLVVPYDRFAVTRHADLETTLLLLAVGVAVTEIAVRARRHHERSDTAAAYVEAVHTTAELIASGRPTPEVTEHVVSRIQAVLGLRACRYQDRTFLGHPPRLEADGHVTWNGARWAIDRHGLPSDEIELLVRQDGRGIGRLMLTPEPGTAPSLQARRVAVTLADQLGASMAHLYHSTVR